MEQKQPAIETRKIEQFISNINVLAELGSNNPNLDTLKSYQGFGGLQQCFNSKQLYGMLMREIRRNFNREQEHKIFETLRYSCKSAYYTPKEIINFMYQYVIQVCGFDGGAILEPACGNGAFFEHMPESIKSKSNVTGIEMDIITSKLVQTIYSNIKIVNNKLQDTDFLGQKYDLIIGNPPYSDEVITDKAMTDISGYTIYHYFIAKCVRLLKDNGILAFLMPAYYMDIPRRHTRKIIDNESVLIDAIRLPENLFEQATVTVDIIFIRKTGKKLHNFVDTVKFTQNSSSDSINQYWQDRPQRILGELKLKWVECYKRYVPTCEEHSSQKILNYLSKCQFDQGTLDNYNAIVNNTPTKNVNLKLNQLKARLMALSDVSISNLTHEIEQLISLADEIVAA